MYQSIQLKEYQLGLIHFYKICVKQLIFAKHVVKIEQSPNMFDKLYIQSSINESIELINNAQVTLVAHL